MSGRSSDDFRQRHQTLKRLCIFPDISFRPVREFFYTVGHSDRDLPAAHRADPIIFQCIGRRQAEIAFAVSVHVVLAFLREELDRTV